MKMIILSALLVLSWSCEQKTKVKKVPEPYVIPPPKEKPGPPVPPDRTGFVNLAYLEDTILLDLQALPSDQDRLDAAYLVGCDFHNSGLGDQADIRKGVDKLINGISTDPKISKTTVIGTSNCVYRISLDDYNISKEQWRLIEREDLLFFVSDTIRNQSIQFLSQKKRPYIFAASMATTVMEGDALSDRGCEIYCTLVEQPLGADAFFASLGVNVQEEYDNEAALYEANATSQISLNKSRGFEILESDDGWIFTSFDSALADVQNHFENPFPIEMANAGGILQSDKIFQDVARETFYSLPNGLFGVRLQAGGLAQSNAGTDIVVDLKNADIDPTIRLAACSNCHNAGFIPFVGQIQDHVNRSSTFNFDEKNLVNIFSNPDAIAATITEIQSGFSKALSELDISTGEDDPINTYLIRPFRVQLDANKVCSYTFLDLSECIERLRGTAISSQTFGNVLGGGTIPLSVFVNGFDTFVDEMLLFRDETL